MNNILARGGGLFLLCIVGCNVVNCINYVPIYMVGLSTHVINRVESEAIGVV